MLLHSTSLGPWNVAEVCHVSFTHATQNVKKLYTQMLGFQAQSYVKLFFLLFPVSSWWRRIEWLLVKFGTAVLTPAQVPEVFPLLYYELNVNIVKKVENILVYCKLECLWPPWSIWVHLEVHGSHFENFCSRYLAQFCVQTSYLFIFKVLCFIEE